MPHTAGPWIRDAEQVREALCRIRADGEPICDVFALDRGYDTPDHDQEEAEANARLIAAAPDMLAALESCMTALQYHIGGNLSRMTAEVCIGEARAAIAKAKPTVQPKGG